MLDLAESIQKRGLIQPITLRTVRDGGLQIVAGERRYRAVCYLGWPAIPAMVRDLTDEEADAVMLLENLKRVDIDPLDEALAYHKRMAAHGYSVAQLAAETGVSETRIRDRLALLRLREEIQHLVRTGNMALRFALAMKDLDNNFQLIALRYFQRTKRPDYGDFKVLCGDLLQKQNQATLWEGFEAPLPSLLTRRKPAPCETTLLWGRGIAALVL